MGTPNHRTGRRPLLLDGDLGQRIVAHIAAGAFDHVAAEAEGVSGDSFREWVRRGEGRDDERPAVEPYITFAEAVRQAKARARSNAEARVYAERPYEWLRVGPGRERPGYPGWTESSKVAISSEDENSTEGRIILSSILPNLPLRPDRSLAEVMGSSDPYTRSLANGAPPQAKPQGPA